MPADRDSGKVTLRVVTEADFPILFEYQRDPEANRMAAFPARDWEAFTTRWLDTLANDALGKRAILVDGELAGTVVSFDQEGQREVGYWLGRNYWGSGIATAALSAYLNEEPIRPLHAFVAEHNAASMRVVEKCGFLPDPGSDTNDDGVPMRAFRLDA